MFFSFLFTVFVNVSDLFRDLKLSTEGVVVVVVVVLDVPQDVVVILKMY